MLAKAALLLYLKAETDVTVTCNGITIPRNSHNWVSAFKKIFT